MHGYVDCVLEKARTRVRRSAPTIVGGALAALVLAACGALLAHYMIDVGGDIDRMNHRLDRQVAISGEMDHRLAEQLSVTRDMDGKLGTQLDLTRGMRQDLETQLSLTQQMLGVIRSQLDLIRATNGDTEQALTLVRQMRSLEERLVQIGQEIKQRMPKSAKLVP